jgi:hypothetical protein
LITRVVNLNEGIVKVPVFRVLLFLATTTSLYGPSYISGVKTNVGSTLKSRLNAVGLAAMPTSILKEIVPASVSVALAVRVTLVPNSCGDGREVESEATGVAFAGLLRATPVAIMAPAMNNPLITEEGICIFLECDSLGLTIVGSVIIHSNLSITSAS